MGSSDGPADGILHIYLAVMNHRYFSDTCCLSWDSVTQDEVIDDEVEDEMGDEDDFWDDDAYPQDPVVGPSPEKFA